jgi:4-amino-4-deoxy-L-arabinose transferase-like glycosyltransferase
VLRFGNSFVLGVFLAALAVRFVPVVFTRHLGIGLDDMFQYDMLARSVALGHGYRWYAPADLARMAAYMRLSPLAMHLDLRGALTTFRAPLYPLLLSGIYAVSGINDGRFFAARLAQAFLGAALAPMTYLVARHIHLVQHVDAGAGLGATDTASERVSRMAAWVVALYPILVLFPLALATENLFFLLLLGSVFLLLKTAHAATSRVAVVTAGFAGILLGLTALTRSVILPFAALAVLWVWFSLKMRLAAFALLLGVLIMIVPWIIRNSLVEHRLTGIETSMGYNLYVGYHPESTGTFVYGPSLDLLSILDDKVRDQYGTQQAIAFIRQDPLRFPYLAARRLGYFFNLELRGFTYFYANDFLGHIPFAPLALILLVLALPFIVLSILTAFGWSLIANNPEGSLLLLLLVGYLLPHVFILSEERFHLALIPFMAIAAAAFWVRGFSAVRARGAWIVTLSVVIVGLLLLNWGLELGRDGSTLLKMLGPFGNVLYLPY